MVQEATTEVVEDGNTPTPEQENAAAEADFAAGFGDGPGTQTAPSPREPSETEPVQTTELEVPQEPKADAKDDIRAIVREQLQSEMGNRLRNIEGNLGGLSQGLKEVLAAAKKTATATGHEAPTDKQIALAAVDPDEWKELETDFPQWAKGIRGFTTAHVAAELLKFKPQQVNLDEIRQSVRTQVLQEMQPQLEQATNARVYARIDLEAGEGWEDTVRSQAFSEWFSRLPQDKQHTYDSDRASGVVAGLKEFQTYQAGVAQRQRRQGRLEAAVEAPTAKVGGPPVLNDDDAFEAGFNGRA